MDNPASPEALIQRLSAAALATLELFAVYLGDRLGFYRALAEGGPAVAAELAARSGAAERYVREWLEQQAAAGILACANPGAAAGERRFALPPGYERALVDADGLDAMTPFVQAVVGATRPLEALVAAFRSGAGVPFAAYGADLRDGLARSSRPLFRHLLVQEWLPAMPDVHARLRRPGARVADIGMGQGWSSIAFAHGYPALRVDGFDLDEASVAAARRNAEAAGVADRVRFEARDAGDAGLAGRYDLAFAFECIHDMADPVRALAAMRCLVGSGGTALVVDELVADDFDPPTDDAERLMYAFSVLHCLPVGMVEQPSAATGTVMRRATFERYARQAGFRAVEELPIEHESYRFYRLTA